jgi:hypothetical protein
VENNREDKDMKLFSYHVYDKWTGDATHGIVVAANLKRAEEKLMELYGEKYNINYMTVYDVCLSVYGKEERIVEIYESSSEY